MKKQIALHNVWLSLTVIVGLAVVRYIVPVDKGIIGSIAAWTATAIAYHAVTISFRNKEKSKYVKAVGTLSLTFGLLIFPYMPIGLGLTIAGIAILAVSELFEYKHVNHI